jgi:hypothetical protein
MKWGSKEVTIEENLAALAAIFFGGATPAAKAAILFIANGTTEVVPSRLRRTDPRDFWNKMCRLLVCWGNPLRTSAHT